MDLMTSIYLLNVENEMIWFYFFDLVWFSRLLLDGFIIFIIFYIKIIICSVIIWYIFILIYIIWGTFILNVEKMY